MKSFPLWTQPTHESKSAGSRCVLHSLLVLTFGIGVAFGSDFMFQLTKFSVLFAQVLRRCGSWCWSMEHETEGSNPMGQPRRLLWYHTRIQPISLARNSKLLNILEDAVRHCVAPSSGRHRWWHVVQHLSPTAVLLQRSGSQSCVALCHHHFVGPCDFSRR